MSGDFGKSMIYEKKTHIHKEQSAKKEVEELLESLQSDCGGCTLEVLSIERIQKEKWQSDFESKKEKLRERADDPSFWKLNDLDHAKKQMRNKLLGEKKVLDIPVYVGVCSDTALEGIAKTGFAATKNRNNWFGSGNYVTRHPWYAARYGMDGCYDEKKSGFLDPRSASADGRHGRLVVGRAVISNVYPITRSCKEDHAIEDFDTAAREEKLESKWFNASSEKGTTLKDDYDTHFVRVKKVNAGDYGNFQACPDDEAFLLNSEIADELVIRETDQLLPQYAVTFVVRKGDEVYSQRSPCSDGGSFKVFTEVPTGSSLTEVSAPSTQCGADTPPNVDVLLVFTEKRDLNYMMKKRERLKSKSLVAHFSEEVSSFEELDEVAKKMNPSVVYIEGGSKGFDWDRDPNGSKLELIEVFIKNLGNTALSGRAWEHWRGCVMNLCTASPDTVENLCSQHPNKLSLFTWVRTPDEDGMRRLWFRFFAHLDKQYLDADKQNAFKYACLETMGKLDLGAELLHMAPSQQQLPGLDARRASFASQYAALNGKLEDLEKDRLTQALKKSEAERAAIEAKFAHEKAAILAKLSQGHKPKKNVLQRVTAVLKGPKAFVNKVARRASGGSIHMGEDKRTRMETYIDMLPPVSHDLIQKVEDIDEFEQNFNQVTGADAVLRSLGSFYMTMSFEAYERLCNRVDGNDQPLYVKLPMAWGGGETRVSKVRPGRICWIDGLMQAQDVHMLCKRLSFEMTGITSVFVCFKVHVVNGMTGESISWLEAKVWWTVANVKRALETDQDIHFDAQELIFDGEILEDSVRLWEKGECTIGLKECHCVRKVPKMSQDRQIYRRLHNAPSALELQAVIEEHVVEFSPVNAAIGLQRVAQLNAQLPTQLMDQVLGSVSEHAQHFNGHAISTSLWSLATLNIKRLDLVHVLVEVAKKKIEQKKFYPKDVSITLWAFATLKIEPQEHLVWMLWEAAREYAKVFDDADLSKFLWAAGTLKIEPPKDLVSMLGRPKD